MLIIKKTFILIVLTLLLALTSVNVFADGEDNNINGTYSISKESDIYENTIDYYVEVKWTVINGVAMISGDTYHWDASEGMYVLSERGQITNVTPTQTTITITNQSNAAVNYSIAYTNEEGYDSTESLEEDSASSIGNIDAAESSNYHSITYKSKITLESVPENQVTNPSQKVGYYTVNITN